MPAVRAFALYAGMALLIDFVMQVIALKLVCGGMFLSGDLLCGPDVDGHGEAAEQQGRYCLLRQGQEE